VGSSIVRYGNNVKAFYRLLPLLFLATNCLGQSPVDSTARTHSPRKATILSAVLPGAGQVYNHKIWKVPIIYGAFVGMGYIIKYNNDKYRKYNTALIGRYDSDTTNVDPYPLLTNDQLHTRSDAFRRDRDYAIAITTLIYLLNIIDAHVDAHLFNFDVSDNLSLHVEPTLIENNYSLRSNPSPGLSLKVSF
jgi:hypothetical protein